MPLLASMWSPHDNRELVDEDGAALNGPEGYGFAVDFDGGWESDEVRVIPRIRPA